MSNFNTKKLLSELTLREKLAQMTQLNANFLCDSRAAITGPASNLKISEADIAGVGTTLNFNGATEMKNVQGSHMDADPHKIPLLFMQDVIHGYRTIYPIPLAMGATFDTALMEKCCAMAAKESTAAGVQVTFGPMVDLVRDARWGRVMESTGEDPYLNCLMSKAQVRGFQNGNSDPKENLSACVKHFAAYGAAEAGRDYNTVDMSEHNLREYYLPAYRAAIDEGVDMVMTSFNLINGIPAAGNSWIINDILRGEWGFDGTIISDYGAFTQMQIHGYCDSEESCGESALKTTTDIEMMSSTYLKYGEKLVAEGKISEAEIDKSVQRILDLKQKHNMFKKPYASASEKTERKLFLSAEHRAICREAAVKSAVLLKNEGVLPFAQSVEKLAVIGPFAKSGMIGFWSCSGREDEAVSAYEGMKNVLGGRKLRYAEGCSSAVLAMPDKEMIAKAVKAARDADAVLLCLGEERNMSGEGNCKVDISLPEAQKALIRAVAAVNKNTAVLLYTGRPLALSDIIDDIPALFIMWQPGTEGGNAAADLVFGKANFEGRLPMSFPYHVGQCPIYYNRMNTGRPKPYEGRSFAYVSNYIDYPNRPLFPFGFGLSYTSFEMSEPTLSSDKMKSGEKIVATVKVKNTGSVVGVAMPELYIRDVYASVTRPIQEMRGFKKLTLAPGEEAEVSFDITEDMLAFHTASGEFKAEAGLFHVWVAESAETGKPVSFNLEV